MANKPAHTMIRPKPASRPAGLDTDEAAFDARLKAETAILAERKQRQIDADKIGKFLGTQWYITDMTWPFLMRLGYQLRVSRFYPNAKVALDLFRRIMPSDKNDIEFKRAQFNANGIRYAAMDWSTKLTDLPKQIGL